MAWWILSCWLFCIVFAFIGFAFLIRSKIFAKQVFEQLSLLHDTNEQTPQGVQGSKMHKILDFRTVPSSTSSGGCGLLPQTRWFDDEGNEACAHGNADARSSNTVLLEIWIPGICKLGSTSSHTLRILSNIYHHGSRLAKRIPGAALSIVVHDSNFLFCILSFFLGSCWILAFIWSIGTEGLQSVSGWVVAVFLAAWNSTLIPVVSSHAGSTVNTAVLSLVSASVSIWIQSLFQHSILDMSCGAKEATRNHQDTDGEFITLGRSSLWGTVFESSLSRETIFSFVVISALLITLGVHAVQSNDMLARRAEIEHTSLLLEFERLEARILVDQMLPSMLSSNVLQKLDSDCAIHQRFNNCTVIFADICGYTSFTSKMSSFEVISFVHRIFCKLDMLCEKHGVEKIKTVGDCLFAFSNSTDDHAVRVANLAVEIIGFFLREEDRTGVKVRVGIATGSAIGTMFGKKKRSWDVIGGCVKLASLLEARASAQTVLMDKRTNDLLKKSSQKATMRHAQPDTNSAPSTRRLLLNPLHLTFRRDICLSSTSGGRIHAFEWKPHYSIVARCKTGRRSSVMHYQTISTLSG
eukprot:ANDGO_05861.mRNA.1 Guanylyl cyclase